MVRMNIFSALTLTARGSTLVVWIWRSSESDVCRRQIQTTKVYPRTVRVKIFLMAVDP